MAKVKKVTRKRVKFEYKGTPGLTVAVAGSFNNWNPTDKVLKDKAATGNYALSVLVPREEVSYKFVVDGEWIEDSLNEHKESDGMGGFNSILAV